MMVKAGLHLVKIVCVMLIVVLLPQVQAVSVMLLMAGLLGSQVLQAVNAIELTIGFKKANYVYVMQLMVGLV
jgi:hypothetical protein